MKKKTKKIIILSVIILILMIKVAQINLIINIKNKIETFEKLENTYYESSGDFENFKMNTNRLYKNNLLIEKLDVLPTGNKIIRIIDFNENKEINIDENSNTYETKAYINNLDIKLKNLPKIIKFNNEMTEEMNNLKIYSILNYFKILYIVPVNYNNISCYKIKTTRETLYTDRNTLYPIYLEYKKDKSYNGDKSIIKINYIFEENTKRENSFDLNALEKYSLK